MMKVQNINYSDKLNDHQFISKCMAGRRAEVSSYNSKDSKTMFSIKTRKNHKDQYISISVRTQQSFRGLSSHIQLKYGGYIIPIVHHLRQIKNSEEAAKSYQNYLNKLIQHRIIRSDPILFSFCFIQQKQDTFQSKYQRFLHNAVDFSRKHLSKLLTREDFQQQNQKDQQLQIYKKQTQIKRSLFQKIMQRVSQKKQIYQTLFSISQFIQFENQIAESYSISYNIFNKCQKINTIFDEIDQAYNRRLIVLEHIKQLKADSIRHKYNSKNQSNEKLLQTQREKHKKWSQILCQQMQCILMIVDSLIKQIISKHLNLERMNYQTDE